MAETLPDPTPAVTGSDPSTIVDRFDDAVDGQLDRLRGNAAVDRLMYSVTELADFSLLWHLIGATRALASEDQVAASVRLSAVLLAEATVVNAGLKAVVKRERPVPDFVRPHNLRMPLTTSFPSGHASAAMCAATLLADTTSSRAGRAAWYGLATLVAASRVHVRIHHASDVVAGALVGLAAGRVARRRWRL